MTDSKQAQILLDVLNLTIGTGLINETLLIWEILGRVGIDLEDAELIAPADIVPVEELGDDEFDIDLDNPEFYDPEMDDVYEDLAMDLEDEDDDL